MKVRKRHGEVLLLACMAALASGATPPLPTENLDEIAVTGEKDRERERNPSRTVDASFLVGVWRNDITRFRLTVRKGSQLEVRFRRESDARRLAPESAATHRLSRDLLSVASSGTLRSVILTLDANVDEEDGVPASIPFGAHASLVNLDYVRMVDVRGETGIGVSNAIDPQTRRCEQSFTLLDEGESGPNRFLLLADSHAECRRIEKSRVGNGHDLVFADSVPEKLRQAVLEVYDPIAVRFANRLGSEPGLVFVAFWPDSPHEGYRFEHSWNRNNLLLFNGTGWQLEFEGKELQALRDAFIAEQVQRRIRQRDWPGVFTASATDYLQTLFTMEQADTAYSWLADSIPEWITDCNDQLKAQPNQAAAAETVASHECGLLVQFVYDAVARAQSRGEDNLYDTWRRLLNASYRRGKSGANSAAFLASSEAAHRIVRGLLDGTVDWGKFSAELEGLGVRLRMSQNAAGPAASVLSMTHFHD